MSDEFVKQMSIDDRLDAYQRFFDHEWAREMHEIAKGKAKLAEVVFDLALSFKGVSLTGAIPLLSVDVAESYSKGHNLESLSNSLTLQLVNHLAARIDQTNVLSGGQMQELKASMLDIAEEFNRSAKGKAVQFPRQELWDGFVKVEKDEESDNTKSEFRLGLWACQRLCYTSLFFAYEDYVVRCMSIQTGTTIRSNRRDFSELCRNTFGSDLADKCWLDSRVVSARLVRNALAHAGGREVGPLKGRPHGIRVVGGVLQIMPHDVASLFDLLKMRAREIAEWAACLSAFD